MIPTQMAADIMNLAFQTEFCMVKVNKFEFSVTSHPLEAFQKWPKHTQKQKRFLRSHFTNGSKCSKDPEKPEFGVVA